VHCGTFGYRLTADSDKVMDRTYRTTACGASATSTRTNACRSTPAASSHSTPATSTTCSSIAPHAMSPMPRTVDDTGSGGGARSSFAAAMVKVGGERQYVSAVHVGDSSHIGPAASQLRSQDLEQLVSRAWNCGPGHERNEDWPTMEKKLFWHPFGAYKVAGATRCGKILFVTML
jgi:hypothetical protein